MKSQNIPALIVSVESRKGGVGKTTAALCLARLLLNKGFTVLVMDLDITGTDAADIAQSPFWKRDLHIIEGTDEHKDHKGALNLITLFDQYFMAGLTIPDFAAKNAKPDTLLIDLHKVNVLGSQIYRTEKGHGNEKGTTCIERPGILFDDLHTVWLLELVKQITDNFVRVNTGNQPGKYAVVLDNSPGYVGIAPAIHEWLTDRGPENGKFLFVTSLDIQDLRACEQAVNALHELFVVKWETSRLFAEKRHPKKKLDISRDQEPFFMRLASSTYGETGNIDPLIFYREAENPSSENHTERGQIFIENPATYIAGIINRVPRAVKTGQLVYEHEYPHILSNSASTFNQILGGGRERNSWRDRMVLYDEYIENQFLMLLPRRGSRYSEHHVHSLIEILEMAEHELLSVMHLDNEKSNHLLKMDFKDFEMLYHQLIKANDILSRARAAVDSEGLGHLARLIHDEWLPGSIVPDFRNKLMQILRESEFPFFEMKPYDFEPGFIHPEAREFMADLKKRMLSELHDKDLRSMAEILSGVLAALAGLSLASIARHTPMRKEIAGLFAGIFSIELRHWAEKGELNSRRFSLQHFLAKESISKAELRKNIEKHSSLLVFRHHFIREDETMIADFYKACTTAQARLIDFLADSRFLLQLLKLIVAREMKQGDLFPFVRGIAEDVIIKKTVSHDDAPKQMAKALKTAEYFREFDGVLNGILNGWGVSNE